MTTSNMRENTASKSLINSDYLLLCCVNFLMILAQRMTNSVLSLYADSLGASGTLTGLLSSAFTITSLILVPLSGQLVNHFSKKKITILSILIIAFATFGFSISDRFEILLVFRLIQGIGLAFTSVSCLTLLSFCIEEENLAKAIAYYSICTSVAQAIGPQLGLMLGDMTGYIQSFRIEALILVFSSLIVSFIRTDEMKKGAFKYSIRKLIAYEALLPAVLIMLVTAANFTITSFITLHARYMNIDDIGIYFLVNAVTLALMRPFADKISRKTGLVRLLPFALICLGLSLLLIGISENIHMFIVASIINAIGYGTSLPIIEALCLKSVCKTERALASATNSIGSNLGILFGPIIAGAIRDVSDYRTMFITMIVPVILSVAIVYMNKTKLLKIEKKEEI